jgi:hypothetical protein
MNRVLWLLYEEALHAALVAASVARARRSLLSKGRCLP